MATIGERPVYGYTNTFEGDGRGRTFTLDPPAIFPFTEFMVGHIQIVSPQQVLLLQVEWRAFIHGGGARITLDPPPRKGEAFAVFYHTHVNMGDIGL